MNENTKKKTLFELSNESVALDDLLNDFDGDVTDEEKEAEIDRFLLSVAENQGSLKNKIDGYIALIAENEARAELRRAEAARLQHLAGANEKTSEKLKARLLFAMQNVLQKEKLETDYHILKVSKAGGKRALILLPEALSAEFSTKPENAQFTKIIPPVEERTVVDNEKIRAALENGEVLAFAELAERRTLLKIK